MIWKLDQLGRSIRDLIDLAAGLSARNVDFRSRTDGFDTATPSGRLLFHILASVAEWSGSWLGQGRYWPICSYQRRARRHGTIVGNGAGTTRHPRERRRAGPIDTNFRHFLPDDAKRGFEDFVIGQVPFGRAGTPEEAAVVALFLLSDDASYVTGSQYVVDGGLIMQ